MNQLHALGFFLLTCGAAFAQNAEPKKPLEPMGSVQDLSEDCLKRQDPKLIALCQAKIEDQKAPKRRPPKKTHHDASSRSDKDMR